MFLWKLKAQKYLKTSMEQTYFNVALFYRSLWHTKH